MSRTTSSTVVTVTDGEMAIVHAADRHVRWVTLRAGVVVGLVSTSLLLWVSLPAWGHTRLESSEPAADDTVTEAFDAVLLVFNEAVSSEFAAVRVTDPAGDRVDVGPPEMAGERVEQPLGPVTEHGEYSVAWRVVAGDGHPLEGTFTFEYVPGSEDVVESADGEVEDTTAPGAEDSMASDAEDQDTMASDAEDHAAADLPTEDVDAAARRTEAEMSEEDGAEAEAPEETGAEDDAPEEGQDAAAAPPGPSAPGRSTWPLAVAAIVVCATAGALLDAVRAVRA